MWENIVTMWSTLVNLTKYKVQGLTAIVMLVCAWRLPGQTPPPPPRPAGGEGMTVMSVPSGGATSEAEVVRHGSFPVEADTLRIRLSASESAKRLAQGAETIKSPVARLGGRVVLDVLIDTSGAVLDRRVLSGHPALVNAVMEAVASWRYRPALLDGVPAQIVTKVEVQVEP
jgi:TonB family protein